MRVAKFSGMMGLFALTFRKAPFEGPATSSATRDGSRRRIWDLAVGLVSRKLPGVGEASVNLTASRPGGTHSRTGVRQAGRPPQR